MGLAHHWSTPIIPGVQQGGRLPKHFLNGIRDSLRLPFGTG
jgi:hypothetical protein